MYKAANNGSGRLQQTTADKMLPILHVLHIHYVIHDYPFFTLDDYAKMKVEKSILNWFQVDNDSIATSPSLRLYDSSNPIQLFSF